MLNDVLQPVLQTLTHKQNPSAESGDYNVLCADGNFRRRKPVLAALFADCPEYSNLHHLEQHVCFWCECLRNELGDFVPRAKQPPQQNQNLYRTVTDDNSKAANAKLSSYNVHRAFNLFGHIPSIVTKLSKPDLLHTMQISILGHIQKLIFHFMKMHKQVNKYNAIWLSVPAYYDLTPKNKSYGKVAEWNVK